MIQGHKCLWILSTCK